MPYLLLLFGIVGILDGLCGREGVMQPAVLVSGAIAVSIGVATIYIAEAIRESAKPKTDKP
jgi:hypothetical protein